MGSVWRLVSLIRSRLPGTNQRGANVRGMVPPRAPTFVWSNVLVPRIRGFNLVGHWALDLKTLSALVCSIGLAVLVQINLDTLLKLKDHNDTIVTQAASVIPCRLTLTRPGSTNLPGRWACRCSVLPWELTLLGIFPEVGNRFQCHSHHTPTPN